MLRIVIFFALHDSGKPSPHFRPIFLSEMKWIFQGTASLFANILDPQSLPVLDWEIAGDFRKWSLEREEVEEGSDLSKVKCHKAPLQSLCFCLGELIVFVWRSVVILGRHEPYDT